MHLTKHRIAHSKERGTTLVEFTITLIFVVFMLGGFIDCSIIIHRWMLLRHATLDAVREASVRFVTMPVCDYDTHKTFFKDFASNELKNQLLVNTKEGELTWYIDWKMPSDSMRAASTFPVLSITSEIPVPCYFFCKFFPKSTRLSATNKSAVEASWPEGLSCQSQKHTI